MIANSNYNIILIKIIIKIFFTQSLIIFACDTSSELNFLNHFFGTHVNKAGPDER